MLIRPMTDDRLIDEYGIRYQQIYPDGGEELAPWGFGRAVVEPGKATEPHSHEENEVFLIVEGKGEMVIDTESSAVAAGVAVFIPGTSRHWIRNTDSSDRLVFVSIYWPPNHGRIEL